MFTCSYIGQSSLVFIEVGIAKLNIEGYSGSVLLSFMIPGNPFTFQKLFIEFKSFTKQAVPVGFRCLCYRISSVNISIV